MSKRGDRLPERTSVASVRLKRAKHTFLKSDPKTGEEGAGVSPRTSAGVRLNIETMPRTTKETSAALPRRKFG
jgi:hypothetical protein